MFFLFPQDGETVFVNLSLVTKLTFAPRGRGANAIKVKFWFGDSVSEVQLDVKSVESLTQLINGLGVAKPGK